MLNLNEVRPTAAGQVSISLVVRASITIRCQKLSMKLLLSKVFLNLSNCLNSPSFNARMYTPSVVTPPQAAALVFRLDGFQRIHITQVGVGVDDTRHNVAAVCVDHSCRTDRRITLLNRANPAPGNSDIPGESLFRVLQWYRC